MISLGVAALVAAAASFSRVAAVRGTGGVSALRAWRAATVPEGVDWPGELAACFGILNAVRRSSPMDLYRSLYGRRSASPPLSFGARRLFSSTKNRRLM